MKAGPSEREFQEQVVALARLRGWRVGESSMPGLRLNCSGSAGAGNAAPTLTTTPVFRETRVMAEVHSIHCLRCGVVLVPSGRGGKYRKTQRYCGPKCARADQTIIVRPASERLWKHVRKTETCWLWTASVTGRGYGQIKCGDRERPAHVVAYESVKGEIPAGLELDHLCRNPLCVNPDHLEPVTHRENVLRGVAPMILTHHSGQCIRGHEFNEKNTYYYRRGPRKGRVAFCRVCKRQKRHEARHGG